MLKVGPQLLATAVTRPENLEDRRIEGVDDVIDERRVMCEKAFLFLDYREMTIKVTRIFECPTHCVTLFQVIDQCTFFRLMTVKFKAKDAEARIIQSPADYLKR